jgi:rhodanese-related sulfurtransferase/rubrerythrin
MKIADIFSKVETVNAEEAKRMLSEKKEGELALIDVREPEEYEEGHLPGAQHVPLSNLLDRLKELDASTPTITYCRSGNRSRSAAAVMKTQGFKSVCSMEGGIMAWNGMVATGEYESGMFLIEGKKTAEGLIAIAWALEEGARVFYEKTGDTLSDSEARQVFESLVKAEEKHKSALLETYRQVQGGDIAETLLQESLKGYMEGGVSVEEALSWVRKEERELRDVLEFSMQMETNSLDLYIKMLRLFEKTAAVKVFQSLIEDEKAHLSRLGKLLGSRMKSEK